MGGKNTSWWSTVKPKMWDEAEVAVERIGGRLLPIGSVIREKQIILELDGKKQLVEPRGWEHFKSKA